MDENQLVVGPIPITEDVEVANIELLNSHFEPLLQGEKAINMSGMSLQDPSLEYFAENLHRFPHIEKIEFGENVLRDQGLKKLAENSQYLLNVRALIFDQNLINNGLKIFCQLTIPLPNLRQLVFGTNMLDDSAMIAVVQNFEKFPNLEKLNLQDASIKDEGVIRLAQVGHKNLQSLELRQNAISDDGLRALIENSEKFPKLQKLILFTNRIKGLNFKGIEAKFESLSELYLDNMRIGDIGLKEIASTGLFKNLKQLSLNDSALTDQGFEILTSHSHYPALDTLFVEDNDLTDTSILTLEKNIANMPKIDSIYMRKNKLMESQQEKWINFAREKLNLFLSL